MKIVINICYGGFSLSPKALLWLWEKGFRENIYSVKDYYGNSYNKKGHKSDLLTWQNHLKGIKNKTSYLTVFSPDNEFVLNPRPKDEYRSHPLLVECVETLKGEANGSCADLKIVEIPDDVNWEIKEYDGVEYIAEKHRTWS